MIDLTSSLLFSGSWDFKLGDLINRCFTKQQTKRLLIAVESKNANIKVTMFFIYSNGKKKRNTLKGMSIGYSGRHFNKKMNGVRGLLTEL